MDWTIIAIVIFIVIVAIILYYINRIIVLSRRVKAAWAQIDVQLKKRNDLVPNLIETVKGYAAHEKSIMTAAMKARQALLAAKGPAAAAKASDMLSSALKSIFALAENYPKLRASENFKLLQEQLEGIESKIAYARQYYNDSVYRYNLAVSTVPGRFFAKAMGYREGQFEFFKIAEKERAVPKVKF
jgi:LemA protein